MWVAVLGQKRAYSQKEWAFFIDYGATVEGLGPGLAIKHFQKDTGGHHTI